MPLDAICLRALTNELKGQLLGARIDKVQQPARDQIVLLLRGNLRLLLNAGPNQPRVQLTEVLRENPAEPPMLCMLLRKHLVGGRITEIEQSGLERIVTFTVRSVNELGESGTKKLVLEAMGRRSNLLLLDEDDRILDCMRRVEFEVSGARALLPGLYYQLPTPLDKLSLLTDPEGAVELAAPRRGSGGDRRALPARPVSGISPLIARELALSRLRRSRRPLRGPERRLRAPCRGNGTPGRSCAGESLYTDHALARGKAGGFHLLSHHAVWRGDGADDLPNLFRAARRLLHRARPAGGRAAPRA